MLALNAGLKNVKIIFPGINTVEFYDSLHQDYLAEILGKKYNPKNVYLLTLGRLTKRKGKIWFIENVLGKLPAHVHYIVAGKPYIMEGQKEDHVLRKAVLKNGLAGRVIFIDTPSDKVRLRLLSACKLFVMPNISVEGDIEGFGIVALEAGVSGTIVVASALEGIQDAVKEGVTGYLVEPEKSHGFISLISDLIGDMEFMDAQGAAARKYIKRNFDWKKVTDRYLQAFAEKKQGL
jgi:phosphatidylinositol alpha-1,6-mannosyltransferase